MAVIQALCAYDYTVVAFNRGDDSPLTALLEFTKRERAGLAEDASLQKKVCDGLMVTLSAGCRVGQRDRQLMNSAAVRPMLAARGVLEYASQPASLQRLCRLAIRNSTRRAHLQQLGLPPRLVEYLLFTLPG